MSDEIYYSVEYAAEILGVPPSSIIASIAKPGPCDMFGVIRDGKVFVPAWELEGNRAAMHRTRLALSVGTVQP